MTRKIAPARLNEFPDHYMRLEQMEERAGARAATRLRLLEHWVSSVAESAYLARPSLGLTAGERPHHVVVFVLDDVAVVDVASPHRRIWTPTADA